MSEASDHNDIQTIRRGILLHQAAHESEFSDSLLKWTISALQISNGGALVVAMGSDALRQKLFDLSGWLLAGGLASSLMIGLSLAKFYSISASYIIEVVWSDKIPEIEQYDHI